ncbi:hypothetical protein CARUB_v10025464mg [Capsella rubella]|uniref:F-box domain-containing protein n=1 Tax=Capsella rubella TaxID=81985 RepID=R0G1B5_9BRAS|nr:F-box/LRR-repeat/kelch-repeat protein At2g29770 [Capsella rubella]EOA29192.1 hypothetical protein CARUB_v10025464mg [Capsella rubella]
MAIISETSDDGSNGGDPNKKPQEEENLAPSLLPIPEELAESILLLVKRCHYPKLSLFSRTFRYVISSPELYQRRLQLGLTEPVLYALIRLPYVSYEFDPTWYILNRNVSRKISLRLSSLPPMSLMQPGSAVVTVGYDMYVIGGCDHPTSNVYIIDCRFHQCRSLPGMQRARSSPAAGVIDRKIYVIGGCEQRDDNWIEVFDIDTGVWSSVAGPYEYNSSMEEGGFLTYVVMQEKIYISDPECCLAYEPRQGTWESWGDSSALVRYWHPSSCVIEDLLYSINPFCELLVYDPNESFWKRVEGVFHLPRLNYHKCKLANVGGKLVVLANTCNRHGSKHVWCIEITVERREGGEVWGEVASRSVVLKSMDSLSIDLCRSVAF